ncbi:MAG: SDR family oxidoreductase [FCB group bacterium]|jgi:citronellol/citronellal dehydrogenase|nr:SDR family oxidoreductase [FCB group bacterium]
MGNVAFVTGASRGIGRAIVLKLAREGYDVVVAAKSVRDKPNLPGTIHSVAEEAAQYGTRVLPLQCDVSKQESIDEAVERTLGELGRIDVVVNNAGALWWRNMDETPMRRFDLVMDVNVRGAFAVTAGFLPAMKAQNSGHVIVMAPPLNLEYLPGHIAYMISKFGMTMLALGLAEEMKGSGLYATALWPKTIIESYATINFNLGDPSVWRKADIMADAVFEIVRHPEHSNGKAVLDEDLLRAVGYTDFGVYNCLPDSRPQDLDEAMRSVRV